MLRHPSYRVIGMAAILALTLSPSREIASGSQTGRQRPQPSQRASTCPTSGRACRDSGFEHQGQAREHPFTKTVVRIPGPSCTLKR